MTNSAGFDTSTAAVLTVHQPVMAALTWKRNIVYLGTKEVAEISAQGVTVTLTDHLGTPRFVVDPTGAVLEQKFLPFGESLIAQADQKSIAKGFTNHEQTDPSGLIYMQARFYVPGYHRFASPDPGRDQHFEMTQSWNIYSYVQNNPVMSVDPTGMKSSDELGGTGYFDTKDVSTAASGIPAENSMNPWEITYHETAQTGTGEVNLPSNVPGIKGTPGATGNGNKWSDHDFQLYVDHAMKDGELSALVKTLGNPTITSGPLSEKVKGAYADGSLTIDTRKIAQNITVGFQEFVKVISHELRHYLQDKLVNSAGYVDLGTSRNPVSGQVTFERFTKQQFNQFVSAADTAYKQRDYRSYAMSPPEIDARIFAEWRSREARW